MSNRVIAVVGDMFFASKIRAAAEALGVEISFARSREALSAQASEARLIVVDLHHQNVDVVALAADLKADSETANIRLIGFFSHVETELRERALAAGFDEVLPRSAFSRDLPEILRPTDGPR